MAAAVLLLAMGLTLLGTISRKSITTDEQVHIPAGYYHLVIGNFHVNIEHPPLAKMWAALPMLLIQPNVPEARDASGHTQRFWQDNHARFEAISYWSRVPMVVLTLSLGWLIFLASRAMFSARAAIVAVALFAMDPTLLAHGRVVHTDVAAALVYLAFWMSLYRYFENPVTSRAAVLGVVAGLALVTKFSMPALIGPVTAVSLATLAWWASPGSSRRRICAHTLLVALLALFVMNAAYRFQHPSLTDEYVRWIEMGSPGFSSVIVQTITGLSAVVPTHFLMGLYVVIAHDYYGHPASLFGRFSTQGWWWYFPAAFALKSSLPFLLVTVASLSWTLWVIVRRRDKRLLLLTAPLALYVGLSMKAHINIGVRHLLPAYPFLFILAGAFVDRLLTMERFPRVTRVLVVLTLGWAVLEAGRAYPSYVSYMNQLAWRGPPWEYLSDSNVEWGDDVKDLAEYLRERGESRVSAALLGSWLLTHYGVEPVDLFRPAPEGAPPKYAAIGASFLNGSTVFIGYRGTDETAVNFFDAYRRLMPEAVFGRSIYLYRLR